MQDLQLANRMRLITMACYEVGVKAIDENKCPIEAILIEQ